MRESHRSRSSTFDVQSSKLSNSLWAEACNTAAYILNRIGKSSEDDKVPYELWYSQNIGKLDHLKIFGTSCYVYIQKQFQSKFDSKLVLGYLIGYVNDKNGYRVWIPSQRKIIQSHDVIFKSEVICNVRNETEQAIKIVEDKKNETKDKTQEEEHEEELDESENEDEEINRANMHNDETENDKNQVRKSTRNKKLPN